MKKSFWIVLILFFANTAKCQLPFGDTTIMNIGTTPVYTGGFAVDANGNTYAAFSNSTAILKDTVLDVPVPVRMIKQNAEGDFIWAKQYGSSTGTIGSISTILEKNGYLVMAGYSTSNFFDNGSVNGVDYSYTYFVARFNANGDILNAVKMPGKPLIGLKEDGTICFATIIPGSGYLGDEFITDNGAFIFGEIDLNGVISWRTINTNSTSEQLKTCAYANGKFYVYGAGNSSGTYFDGQYMTSPNGTNYGYLAKIDLASHSIEAYKGVSNAIIPGMEGLSAPFIDVDDSENVYLLAQYNSSYATTFYFNGTAFPLQPNQAYILKLNNQLNLIGSILLNQASNNPNMRMRQLDVHDSKLFTIGSIDNMTHLIKYTTNFEEISRMSLINAENPNDFDGILSMYIDDNDQISIFQHQNICMDGFCGNHLITRSKANSNVLQGRAYKDMDENGSFGSGDIPIGGAVIQVQPTNELIVTDVNGYYTLNVDTGVYQLNLGTVPTYFTQLPCSWTFLALNQIQTADLILAPQPGGHDLQLDIIPFSQAVVGSTLQQKLIVSNQGTYTENGSVYIVPYLFNGGLTFTALFPYTTSGDTIIYSLNALNPEDTLELVLNYDIPLSMLSMLGETDQSYSWISSPIEDTIENHTISSWVMLVAAYDPNLKESSIPQEIIYTNQLDKKVTYTIHFQNEGNFPAENIEVRDRLSNKFDLNTIKILDFSDPMYATIENNEIRFHFDDIFLPDKNSNEEESKGYVSFSVELTSAFETGDQVCNQADIYFDYNPAIITNNYCIEVSPNTASLSELPSENNWMVYPNPFSDRLQLIWIPDQGKNYQMIVSDELGRVVQRIPLQESVDLSNLKSGTYILTILSEDKMTIGLPKKIIKVGG